MSKIILASKSPRRIEMLKKYIDGLIVCSPDIKEYINEDINPCVTVMKLAFQKAYEVFRLDKEKGIIIAADTVVYLDKLMGKPKSYDEAYKMLEYLSNKKHEVYTGICIIDSTKGNCDKKIVDFEKTIVEFNLLDEETIKNYLSIGEYIDKAGSYGIQGYGEILVKKIDGCYNNVKGLPISKLNNILKKYFCEKLF